MTSGAPGPLVSVVDLLGRRFALSVFWELRGAPQSFERLARALGAPSPALSQRLQELRRAGLTEIDETGNYRLSPHGRRLEDPLLKLDMVARELDSLTTRQRTPRGAAPRGRGEPPLP